MDTNEPIATCQCGESFEKVPTKARFWEEDSAWHWACPKCSHLMTVRVRMGPKDQKNFASLVDSLEEIDAMIEASRPDEPQ